MTDADRMRVRRERAADLAVEAVNRILPQWLMYLIIGMVVVNLVFSVMAADSSKTYNVETRRIAKVNEVRSLKNEAAIKSIEAVQQLTDRLEDATAQAAELTLLLKQRAEEERARREAER